MTTKVDTLSAIVHHTNSFSDLATTSSSWTLSSSLPTHYVPRVLSPLHELSRKASHRRSPRNASPSRVSLHALYYDLFAE